MNSVLVNEETICYEVAGRGPAVVLVHGWTLNLRMWDPQVPSLSRRFQVIRYDRRGFGRSSGREDLSWDTADLAALLDRLGVAKAHILGMSQGGGVALSFARAFPDRAMSVILHGSVPPSGFALRWSGPDRIPVREWQSRTKERGLEAFRREWAEHPLMRVPEGRADVRARLEDLLAEYRGEHLLDSVPRSGPIGPITMDDLPRLMLPALVVIGDAEVPYLQLVARMFAYYLPNAQLAIIRGGGHLINLIEPEQYNATILRFLETAIQGPP
ncbi:MAG TPA: alpha/beta hydrolase [bacterium]|nr:alpha/beta hydrolase [bacterium]